jgi:hypothetical protein
MIYIQKLKFISKMRDDKYYKTRSLAVFGPFGLRYEINDYSCGSTTERFVVINTGPNRLIERSLISLSRAQYIEKLKNGETVYLV